MHREVCLKHRKNRREIFLRVRTQVPSWQRCLFFFFLVSGADVEARAAHLRSSSKSRMPECHQAMPVQFRLPASFFKPHHVNAASAGSNPAATTICFPPD
jgi:hypothetical protein